MIAVLFPPGAFGSTIEYSLREFGQELRKVSATVTSSGSMHSFRKIFHPVTLADIKKIHLTRYEVVTPVYPGLDGFGPRAFVQEIIEFLPVKTILIHFDTASQVDRNQLFCYHKIPNFIKQVKASNWNPAYSQVEHMQPHELREALSLLTDQAQDYIDVKNQVPATWMCVTPDQILYDFEHTIARMIAYCGLTPDPRTNPAEFYAVWFEHQQYILNEFHTVQQIIENLNNPDFNWNPVSIMAEAMVQAKLRQQGWKIACYQLNQFPTNIQDLRKVMLPL
jgi:hypothetical protein